MGQIPLSSTLCSIQASKGWMMPTDKGTSDLLCWVHKIKCSSYLGNTHRYTLKSCLIWSPIGQSSWHIKLIITVSIQCKHFMLWMKLANSDSEWYVYWFSPVGHMPIMWTRIAFLMVCPVDSLSNSLAKDPKIAVKDMIKDVDHIPFWKSMVLIGSVGAIDF